VLVLLNYSSKFQKKTGGLACGLGCGIYPDEWREAVLRYGFLPCGQKS